MFLYLGIRWAAGYFPSGLMIVAMQQSAQEKNRDCQRKNHQSMQQKMAKN